MVFFLQISWLSKLIRNFLTIYIFVLYQYLILSCVGDIPAVLLFKMDWIWIFPAVSRLSEWVRLPKHPQEVGPGGRGRQKAGIFHVPSLGSWWSWFSSRLITLRIMSFMFYHFLLYTISFFPSFFPPLFLLLSCLSSLLSFFLSAVCFSFLLLFFFGILPSIPSFPSYLETLVFFGNGSR